MTSVAIRDLSVALDGNPVLQHVSMTPGDACWTVVIGPNGAGKTTLLRTIAGLVDFQGSVEVGDTDLRSLRRRELARLVAYVPQQPLIPRALTVADYALMGRTPYIPYLGVETAGDIAVVESVLQRLDLEDFADRVLGSLSGGELQRVVLSRALAQQAPILLLDEPTSALDVGHQQQVLELVDALRQEHDLTVISAMHDLTLAAQYADELILLDAGKVVSSGSAAEVLTEGTIETHYGASVNVFRDNGSLVIAPRRSVK